ncbi:MAG: adenosylcobinamide-phosphate synthase CbiB [Lachnospiraceae bacterium]
MTEREKAEEDRLRSGMPEKEKAEEDRRKSGMPGDGKTAARLQIAGSILWLLVCILTLGVVTGVLALAEKVHPVLAFAIEAFWCYQLLALTSLRKESMKVYEKLKEGDLPGARYAVSMIVGRDTENLTEEGVTKAAVETIAENTSDGVTAPLFYMLIGGAPLAFLYKAVNTMDSMIGYKNDRYLYFGRTAAKMDDIFNFLPARISAVLMIAAAGICRLDIRKAWQIYLRDRHNHASPNAAQTEAVCAGALGVQLAGNAFYFGKLYEKPTIGDPLRDICPGDIPGTCALMYVTAVLMLVLGVGIRAVFIW